MSAPAHVAICVATFQRPDGLRRLLTSLNALTFPSGVVPRLTVVIADNDAASTLAAVDFELRHPQVYRLVPRKGLAEVRNAALDAAPETSDFIAFIDDDEWAVPEWLDALLVMQRQTSADIVQGVVLPVYPVPEPAWMRAGHYHEVGPFEDGAALAHGASGNVLIRRSSIGATRFHQAFNASGGEDVDFFHALLQRGARMVAASRAVAFEDVPLDRMTLRWILRRRFRTGHTLGLIARRQGGVLPRLVKAGGRIGVGVLQFVSAVIRGRTAAVAGITNVAWGFGTITALVSGQSVIK
jgi:succinoglycan biosynthesis protein ExoM